LFSTSPHVYLQVCGCNGWPPQGSSAPLIYSRHTTARVITKLTDSEEVNFNAVSERAKVRGMVIAKETVTQNHLADRTSAFRKSI
jgi:hypothetical protein